jgi:hypothetical protein
VRWIANVPRGPNPYSTALVSIVAIACEANMAATAPEAKCWSPPEPTIATGHPAGGRRPEGKNNVARKRTAVRPRQIESRQNTRWSFIAVFPKSSCSSR